MRQPLRQRRHCEQEKHQQQQSVAANPYERLAEDLGRIVGRHVAEQASRQAGQKSENAAATGAPSASE
jgi:hypothetical protein